MNYYNEIKQELVNNEINKRIKDYSKNKSDLNAYYNVGKLLSEAGKHYGEGIIKEYSYKLSIELNIKYDISSLNKMKKFYNLVKKMATVSPNLSYSHYVELLPCKDINKVKKFIKIINNDINRKLKSIVKTHLYKQIYITFKNKKIIILTIFYYLNKILMIKLIL